MKFKIKTWLIVSPFVGVIYYIFFNYAPWLSAKEPIENLKNHNLSNLPPPDGAISFAVNHGAAIYYYEKTQLELIVVSTALLASISVVVFLAVTSYRNGT